MSWLVSCPTRLPWWTTRVACIWPWWIWLGWRATQLVRGAGSRARATRALCAHVSVEACRVPCLVAPISLPAGGRSFKEARAYLLSFPKLEAEERWRHYAHLKAALDEGRLEELFAWLTTHGAAASKARLCADSQVRRGEGGAQRRPRRACTVSSRCRHWRPTPGGLEARIAAARAGGAADPAAGEGC